jgi:two-component system phosphate regulon sensor histidine kinase PhoR
MALGTAQPMDKYRTTAFPQPFDLGWETMKMSATEHSAGGGGYRLNLQSAIDFQAALLGIAGHDLRQPLAVIQLTYEWLGAPVRTKSDQELLELGQMAVKRLTEQLDRLAAAIHLYEQTKSIEISSIEVAPVLWQACNENKDAALNKNISIKVCPTRASVVSNTILLNSIFRNLVSNAIKYTQSGGRILIGCRRSGNEVRIDIYDTGIGIAKEHLLRIFEAFTRLDSTLCDGLGIGLFVVRRAVDVLAHHIAVSSVISKGSRFSIFAPRAQLIDAPSASRHFALGGECLHPEQDNPPSQHELDREAAVGPNR